MENKTVDKSFCNEVGASIFIVWLKC